MDDVVGVLVSQEKWKKAQAQVGESDRGIANQARLESIRGFLLYLSRMYPIITPYIKGLHLTIDGWRPDRDAKGWRKPEAKHYSPRSAGLGEAVERNVQKLRVWNGEEEGWEEEELEAPTEVKLMPQMGPDVSALERFFSTKLPPLRVIRGRLVLEAFYGFRDASGTGFGASFDGDTSKQIFYRFGQWCTNVSEESSNYRELRNLVESLCDFLEEYDLTGLKYFYLRTTLSQSRPIERETESGRNAPTLYYDTIRQLRSTVVFRVLQHVPCRRGTVSAYYLLEGSEQVARNSMPY
jgi:hypothetical protein